VAQRDEIIAFADELLDAGSYRDYGPMGMQVVGAEQVTKVVCGVSSSLELFERSRARNDVDRWSYVLFKTFLPALNLTYGDRTSMAVSVELRVPFLDRALVEQAGRIPAELKMRDGRQKWVLGEAARPWLPAEILTRPKTGFGAPLRRWLANDLHGLMRDVLLGERMAARGLFVREGVEQLLADLETGRRDVAYIVWALFTFELWARTFVDGDGSAPVAIGA